MIPRPRAALVAAVLLATATQARGAGEHLPNVKRLYEQLYFNEAMTACVAALQAGRLSRPDLLETLRFQGLIAASMGRDAEAVEAFRRFLAIDPSAELGPGHAPRIRRAFESARRWSRKHGGLRLEATAPPSASRTQPIPVTASVASDPLGMVHRLVLYVRGRETGAFTDLPAPPGARHTWQVEARLLETLRRAPGLEYYLVALDRGSSEVALLGSREAPARVSLLGPPLLPPPPPALPTPDRSREAPLVKRWWFWTAIGAGVALVTGLSVGLATRSPSASVNAPVSIESGP